MIIILSLFSDGIINMVNNVKWCSGHLYGDIIVDPWLDYDYVYL